MSLSRYLNSLQPCTPPPILAGGHLQTIAGHLWSAKPIALPPEKTLIKAEDGGNLLAYVWYVPGAKATVLMFHGLGGSSESGYMQRIGLALIEKGFNVALVNHRGIGDAAGLAQGPTHSGRGEDVSAAVRWVRGHKKLGELKVLTIGFSLGASMVLNLVTEQRGSCMPDGAIAVNPPVDLEAAQIALERGLSRLYDARFVQDCRKHIHLLTKRGEILHPPKFSWNATIRDIDEHYTAKFGGFTNALDYYAKCSTYERFDMIKVPTFLLTAKDDPFIPWQAFERAKNNSRIALHIEEKGGHLGYISTMPPHPVESGPAKRKKLVRWMDDVVTEAAVRLIA